MRRMVNNAEKLNAISNASIFIPSRLLGTEKYENASKTEEGQYLIEAIKMAHNFLNIKNVDYELNIALNKNLPYYKNRGCVGVVNSENTAYLMFQTYDEEFNLHLFGSNGGNSLELIQMQYDERNDVVEVSNSTEVFISEDNIKTLFGQSITGTGNIDLYVHHLLINSNCYFTIYSSNNLNVDTPEKLTTLLKDKNTSIYYFGYLQTQYITIAAISFNASTNLWRIRVSGEETSSEITDITDIVTAI